MKYTSIYVLIDPRNNKVRYVGKSNNIKQRYMAHINKARKQNLHKYNWINLLKRLNLKPKLKIIEIVPISKWKSRERYWIKYYRNNRNKAYKLLNYDDGGNGLTFGNQTSFKKGNKVWLGKKHTEESKKKISLNNGRKGKPAVNRRKVIQRTLSGKKIKIYDCIQHAAIKTNSKSSKIISCCKNKRKTHNNFIWEYYK